MLGSPQAQEADTMNGGVYLKCLLPPITHLPFLLPFHNIFKDTLAGVLALWKDW